MIQRAATKADLPAIIALKASMFAETGRAHLLADRFEELVLADYERLYDAGEAAHFVAVEGDEIVAMAGGFIKADLPYRYFKNPRYGFVGDVYTRPLVRKMGLARDLSELVLSWCWSQGVNTVRLLASEAGRPIYAALGFVSTDEMVLHRGG
ncbi:MAG TPA: GNAT family N-acetyltransferase [Vicinamibacterales bacterium]|nr:GNAT family N-acetyltransferase [Vicinamibacterales bacterium]